MWNLEKDKVSGLCKTPGKKFFWEQTWRQKYAPENKESKEIKIGLLCNNWESKTTISTHTFHLYLVPRDNPDSSHVVTVHSGIIVSPLQSCFHKAVTFRTRCLKGVWLLRMVRLPREPVYPESAQNTLYACIGDSDPLHVVLWYWGWASP